MFFFVLSFLQDRSLLVNILLYSINILIKYYVEKSNKANSSRDSTSPWGGSCFLDFYVLSNTLLPHFMP